MPWESNVMDVSWAQLAGATWRTARWHPAPAPSLPFNAARGMLAMPMHSRTHLGSCCSMSECAGP